MHQLIWCLSTVIDQCQNAKLIVIFVLETTTMSGNTTRIMGEKPVSDLVRCLSWCPVATKKENGNQNLWMCSSFVFIYFVILKHDGQFDKSGEIQTHELWLGSWWNVILRRQRPCQARVLWASLVNLDKITSQCSVMNGNLGPILF